MSLPRPALLFLVWLTTVAAICNPGENPPPGDEPVIPTQPDGGPPVDAEPSGDAGPSSDGGPGPQCTDPCQGDLTLFGPETVERHCGEPKTLRWGFGISTEMDVCVLVTNHGNASARLWIDGGEVVGPSAFNPHVTEITATVNLGAGEHELAVRVVSIPGTSITVELRACQTGDPPAPIPCSEMATQFCVQSGWGVSLVMPGGLICTAPGVDYTDNCATCEDYNLFVWEDGTGDPLCPRDYNTYAGELLGGHEPCACTNDLLNCGTWELGGCIPD